MNLRDIGIEWHSQELGLTLWLHPGTSFGRLSLVMAEVQRLLGDKNMAFRAPFIIADAFVLDYESKSDDPIPLVGYFKQRSLFDIESNLNAFMTVLEYQDVDFLHSAFQATRVQPDTPEGEPDDLKKTKATLDSDG